MAKHSSLTGSQLHEPKGVDTATNGQIYLSNGAGSGSWTTLNSGIVTNSVTQGFWDYNDLTTASTPIPLSLASTPYEMTNDGAGPNTLKTYGLSGITDIWNTSTNRFNFNNGSILELGDTVDIRFDLEVTTSSPNTAVEFELELALGASPYTVVINPFQDFKTAGTYKIIRWLGIYMGNTDTLNNPARILAEADSTGVTVKVNGWYIRALKST